MFGWTFTNTFHRKPYPAISPSRPELSQTGKNVVVAGANSGIGLAIARAFGQAGAAKVFVLGRRQASNKAAVAQLTRDLSGYGSKTEFIPYQVDMSKPSDIEALFKHLATSGIEAHVLVLNAASIAPQKPLLEVGAVRIMEEFAFNVGSLMLFTELFYKQSSPGASLVNVSSFAIHDWINAAAHQPAYGLSKSVATAMFGSIAQSMPAERMQIVNMNPGPVLTESARKEGYKEADFDWNDPNLCGHFANWCASREATFLHGRFVWNEWDVNELQEGLIREQIGKDPLYLKVGVKGL